MPPASPVPAPALTGTDEVRPERGRQPGLREVPPAPGRGVRRRLEARLFDLLERVPGEPPVPRGLVHEIEDLIADAGPSGLEVVEEIAFEHRAGTGSESLRLEHFGLWSLLSHACPDFGDADGKLRFLERGYGSDSLVRERLHPLAAGWWEYSLDLSYLERMRGMYEWRLDVEDETDLIEGNREELDMLREDLLEERLYGDPALWLGSRATSGLEGRDARASHHAQRGRHAMAAVSLTLWDPGTEEQRGLVALARALDRIGVSDIWMYFVPRERIKSLPGLHVEPIRGYSGSSVPAVARHGYAVRGNLGAAVPVIQDAVDEGLHRRYVRAELKSLARQAHQAGALNVSRIRSAELRRAATGPHPSRPPNSPGPKT